MGADLIGYQTMLPMELTNEEKKECHTHLDELEGLLKSPDFLCKIAAEESAEEPLLKELNRLSPLAASEMNNLCYGDGTDPDDLEELDDYFTSILNLIPYSHKFIEEMDFGDRDTSWRVYKILGRKFYSVFAGEMSYGDEPEGGGYETLKGLDMVGLLSKIESMTIPSEPLSVQFIKDKA